MYAKNTGTKVIGFGDLSLLPGATDELPTGYDEKHPAVAYYIAKGWLTPAPSASAADASAEEASEGAEGGTGAAVLAARIKELDKMNLEPLRDLAVDLGIDVSSADTKAAIKEKIISAYQSA